MTSVHTQHESLSALFDGELHGDAGRFASRRLGHDPDWQGRVERWQLIGDVMRGQAVALAAPGFAAGVSRAIAAETAAVAEAAVPSIAPVPRRRTALWSGLALAASVAAAVVLVRPAGEGPTTAAPAPIAAAAQAPVRPPAPAIAAPTPVAEPVSVAALAPSRAVARTRDVPRRSTVVRTAAEPVQALAMSAVEPAPVRVFAPPADDTLVSRPWPRATLPALSTGEAVTASLGQAPSFYPFEPPADAAAPPAAPPP